MGLGYQKSRKNTIKQSKVGLGSKVAIWNLNGYGKNSMCVVGNFQGSKIRKINKKLLAHFSRIGCYANGVGWWFWSAGGLNESIKK